MMTILILDLTHGGDILAEEYLSRGEDVTCVDVYRIGTKEKKQALSDKGATVTDVVPEGHYDTLISPAHCPDFFLGSTTFDRRMTFSQAVNELIDDKKFRIEVTGVKGKTSSCYLLAQILYSSGKSVFLHTSRGEGPWTNDGHRIDRNMSIAPTSLLRLPEFDYDCIISEVSLGGSGKADIAVITNLTEDYGIAKNTRKASDAKADILTDKVNIVRKDELSLWQKYGERKFETYGDSVKVIEVPKLGKSMKINISYKNTHHTVKMNGSFLSIQYIQAIELVLKICETMDIPLWAIIGGLKSFSGVPGRGEVSLKDGVWHIKDRNPGISHLSIGMTLECLKEMGELDNAVAVIDPVSKKVCDKMDSVAMKEVADRYGVPVYFTDRHGSKPELPSDVGVVIEFIKEGYQ